MQKDDVFYQVQNKLKRQLKTDPIFKEEIQSLYYFYERKLMNFARKEGMKKYIIDEFEDVVFSQYFQGYYVMKVILNDEETEMEESSWNMSEGFARNVIPPFINNAFKEESTDWSYTEVSHKFGMELLDLQEAAYDLFKQIRFDIACYGAFKAFIEDERYVGNEGGGSMDLWFGNPLDLVFLNPQVYMQAQFSTAEHEVWDLHTWTSFRDSMWVGSIHLSTLPQDESTGQVIYLLEVKLSNTIAQDEKLDIVNFIVNKLPVEIQNALQTRLYYVEDFDVIIPRRA